MRWLAASVCATAMGMTACGGGGGNSSGGGEPAPARPELYITAVEGDTGRAPSGVVHTRRIALRNAGAARAVAVVVSVSPSAQALQLPLTCESSGCVQRSDGSLEIGEVAAGATVWLRQSLRIKPHYRGPVVNEWQASTTETSLTWRQELTAYVADVSVAVSEPEATSPTLSYEVTLANAGPDEAVDVRWGLLTLPAQTWRIAGCSATAGGSCPVVLGEAMTLPRLAAGGSVKLTVDVDAPADSRLSGMASRAAAAGDADPRNDEASNGSQKGAHHFMTDLEGRHYRLSLGIPGPLRATAAGVDYRANFFVDVTGAGFLGEPGDVNPPWSRGTLGFFGPIQVLGLDIGGRRKPYLAPRDLVTQLSELEGFSFTVLGSRADASGKPLEAYTGSARFKDGALLLCLPDSPTPFDQCPTSRLSRFEAAMVGSEVELVSRDKALRLRAARSSDGPILISSSRDAASEISEFWMGVPVVARAALSVIGDMVGSEATFESASGLSTTVLGSIDTVTDGSLRIRPVWRGLPNSYLLWLNSGTLGLCGLEGTLSAGVQPGLFQGTLRGDWLPGTVANGEWVKERVCFAGAVHHAQTSSVSVFLGARGGDLMGRWMIASQ